MKIIATKTMKKTITILLLILFYGKLCLLDITSFIPYESFCTTLFFVSVVIAGIKGGFPLFYNKTGKKWYDMLLLYSTISFFGVTAIVITILNDLPWLPIVCISCYMCGTILPLIYTACTSGSAKKKILYYVLVFRRLRNDSERICN